MPTADAHLHLFAEGFDGALGPAPEGFDDLAAYERLRRGYGIERGLVVGYEGESRYAGNNDHVLALAAARPWMAVVAYLPIAPAPTAERLRSLRARGAIGFAIYLPDVPAAQVLLGWPAEALDELRGQRALLSLNARPEPIGVAAPLLAALDGCPILVSHLGLPGQFARPPSASQARERLVSLVGLGAHAHVAVKFSGLYAISDPAHDFPHAVAQPFLDLLLDTFGPARLLWGSDFSPALDSVSFAQAADPRLLGACSPHEVENVMGGNLLRLLRSR